jgi:ketosteroid isomerase-like protein
MVLREERVMKILSKGVLIVLCITFFSSVQLFGQEWSEQQKEVWNNVETYMDLSAKGDLEGFLDYVHDDYSGWSNQDALPGNKASTRKFLSHIFKARKILVQDLQPVAIKIHNNVAIVQYYYTRILKDTDGKEKNVSGRWTDILMKQGDKWVLIGDSGGPAAD